MTRSLEQSTCQEWRLDHPQELQPEDFLQFVYLDEFAGDWAEIFAHDEDETALWALEICIMADPLGAPVISGTGGLRKLRFSKDEDAGKSGGARVCYAYFPEHFIALMVMAFTKDEKANLTPGEKKAIKGYLNQVKKWLDSQ